MPYEAHHCCFALVEFSLLMLAMHGLSPKVVLPTTICQIHCNGNFFERGADAYCHYCLNYMVWNSDYCGGRFYRCTLREANMENVRSKLVLRFKNCVVYYFFLCLFWLKSLVIEQQQPYFVLILLSISCPKTQGHCDLQHSDQCL